MCYDGLCYSDAVMMTLTKLPQSNGRARQITRATKTLRRSRCQTHGAHKKDGTRKGRCRKENGTITGGNKGNGTKVSRQGDHLITQQLWNNSNSSQIQEMETAQQNNLKKHKEAWAAQVPHVVMVMRAVLC